MLKRFMGYRCFRRPLPLIARPWSLVARRLSLEIPLCLPYCTYLTLLCLTLLTCFTYLPVGKQLFDGSRVVNLKLVACRLSLEIPLSLPYFTYLTLPYPTLLTYVTYWWETVFSTEVVSLTLGFCIHIPLCLARRLLVIAR